MKTPTARHAALGWGVVIAILLAVKLFIIDPANTKTLGIGVSRQRVQSFFEQPMFGFTVESADMVDGQPGISMTSPVGTVGLLKLIGPRRELIRATLAVGAPRGNDAVTTKSALYLNAFILAVAPDWKDGSAWIRNNLDRALTAQSVSTTLDNPGRIVSLGIVPQPGIVMVSIKADP